MVPASSVHNPILHGLASSYEVFRLSHDRMHSNCIRAFIINNPIFVREQGNRELLDYKYLELDERVANKISSMTAMDFFNVNGLKTRMEVILEFGFNLSVEAYAKIATSLNYFVRKMRPNNRNNSSVRSVIDEFLTLKQPGKKTRLWIAKNQRDKFDIAKAKSFVTCRNLIGVELPDKNILSARISMWNTSRITNLVRKCFKKFYNNILGLNVRTSHFVPNQNRNCAFCSDMGQISEESFIHLFFDCPTTRGWQEEFLSKYIIPPGDLTREEKISFFFFGTLPGFKSDNTFVGMAALIFQYCVWEQKLTKKRPSFNTLVVKFNDTIISLLKCNRKVRNMAESINLLLCRHFGATNNLPAWRPAPAVQQRRKPP